MSQSAELLRRAGLALVLYQRPLKSEQDPGAVGGATTEPGGSSHEKNRSSVCRGDCLRGCRTIPLSHLDLDLSAPMIGWKAVLAARGVEIVLYDVGRPANREKGALDSVPEPILCFGLLPIDHEFPITYVVQGEHEESDLLVNVFQEESLKVRVHEEHPCGILERTYREASEVAVDRTRFLLTR